MAKSEMNNKSNNTDSKSIMKLFLRSLNAILMMLVLFVFILFLWLKKGIYIENIHTKSLKINHINLKLDNKLSINIKSLDVIVSKENKTKRESSENDNQSLDLSSLTYLYSITQTIQINKININNKIYRLDFSDNYLKIKHKDTIISSNFSASSDALYINISLRNLPNIKFIKDFVRLNPLIEEWMYDNVIPSRLSATILLKINNDGSFDFNYLKAYGIIHNPKLTYHKSLAPLEADYAKVELKNSTLSFNLIHPRYKDIKLNSAIASLSDIIFVNKPILDIKLDINHQINKTPFEILKAYDIELFEVEQLSGKSNVKVDLSIDLLKEKLTYKAGIIAKKPKLRIFGLDILSDDLTIDIINNKINIKTNMINYNDKLFIKPNKIRFDTDNLVLRANANMTDDSNISVLDANLKLDFLHNQGLVKVDLKELNFDKFLDINTSDNITFDGNITLEENLSKVYIDIGKYDTNVLYDFDKNKMIMKISNIDTIKQYSHYLKHYNIQKANFIFDSDDFSNFNIYSSFYNLDLPIYSNGILMKDISFSTNLRDDFTTIFHKNFTAKFDDKILVNFNNIDFKFYSKDLESREPIIFDKNITINTNNCTISRDNHILKIKKGNIEIRDNNSIKVKAFEDNAKFEFYQKDNLYYFKATDFTDDMMNNLVGNKLFKKGKISFAGYQRKGIVSGSLEFKKTTLKNISLFNNLFAFINTAPAIINPLLAIPNLLSSKNLGFSSSGYRVEKGEVLFDYDINNSIAKMQSIDISADSADIKGVGEIDFSSDALKMKLEVSFLKSYSKIIDKIPFIGYIMLGKDGTIAISLDAKGKINNPKIRTHMVKDGAKLPFKMTKRVLLSPFEFFGFDVD